MSGENLLGIVLLPKGFFTKKTYPKRADLAGSGVSLLVQKYCFFMTCANIPKLTKNGDYELKTDEFRANSRL